MRQMMCSIVSFLWKKSVILFFAEFLWEFSSLLLFVSAVSGLWIPCLVDKCVHSPFVEPPVHFKTFLHILQSAVWIFGPLPTRKWDQMDELSWLLVGCGLKSPIVFSLKFFVTRTWKFSITQYYFTCAQIMATQFWLDNDSAKNVAKNWQLTAKKNRERKQSIYVANLTGCVDLWMSSDVRLQKKNKRRRKSC